MSKFLTTLKYNVLNNFAINKLRKKKDPSKFSAGKIFLFVLLGLFLFGTALLYSFMFIEMIGAEFAETLLSLGIFMCVLLSLIVTVSNAISYLFKSKDFNLLMSLPLKTNTVVLTKISYLLLINYVLFAFLYLPILIVYGIYVETTLLFWVLAILTFILLPLFPVSISTFIAYGLSLILPRFRYKNLLTIIFSLALMVFIMVINFSTSIAAEDPSRFSQSISQFLSKTGEWAYNGMKGDFLDYLFFILISVIPFVVLIKLLGFVFLKANTRFSSSISGRKYKYTDLKIKGQGTTLAKKELKRYFGSPMYVLNTIVGPLLSTVSIVVFANSIGKGMGELDLGLGAIQFVNPIIVGLGVFMLGITSTTGSCISIGGKQFWIFKSSPNTPKQVFHGKIIVNLVITVPFLIINAVLAVVLLNFGVLDTIMLIVIPLLVTLFMSYMGLFVNLLFPRFDYDSDVKAIKQSLSVLITMGVGFVVAAIIIGTSGYVYSNTGNPIYTYLTGLITSLVFAILSIVLLYTKGEQKYNKIEI